jgi:MFS family permease
MLLMGGYNAFGKYYRFAAADVADDSFKAKAISLTLAGGLVGGIIGPELAKHTIDWFPGHLYLGAYLSLALICALTMVILTRLDIPQLADHERRNPGRPIGEIMRRPVFIVAVLASAVSYGIMNLLMTSTPLAMRAHDFPFTDAAFVLQWHVIGMYAPSFFTGSLINRFGALNVIVAGIVLNFVCITFALAGTALFHFWMALFLLGVGWNFMYVAGSALLTECYTPSERAKTQAANDFLVFTMMAVSSTASGVLLNKSGWQAVNWGSIPFLLLSTVAAFWLISHRRRQRLATAPR